MTVKDTSARDIAVLALRDREGNVSAHLERLLGREAPGSERALAEELTLGAVKRRATLEAVLRAFLAEPGRKLPGALNEILHVALYQLLFLDRIPDFAAVNEAVEQAGRFHHRRQGGLVNGILRTVLRALGPLEEGSPPPAQDILQVGPGSYRRLARAVFADPAARPEEYLAGAMSLPIELARRWVKRCGLERAAELGLHANARPPMTLRPNRLRADRQKLLDELAAAGVPARPHANGVSVVLDHGVNIAGLDLFRRGLVQPQDATATGVCLRAAPPVGGSVLDFCAAPGTKTTHLGELMENRGSIVAVDVSDDKLQRIVTNAARLGVDIVQTVLADQVASLPAASFDLVLADVPCSNTGVLARRAEARWHFSEQALSQLARDQRVLIALAASFVRPGGRLVYSTCSIEPEECSQVAAHLPRVNPKLRLADQELTLPAGADDAAAWRDGGYVAVFEARG